MVRSTGTRNPPADFSTARWSKSVFDSQNCLYLLGGGAGVAEIGGRQLVSLGHSATALSSFLATTLLPTRAWPTMHRLSSSPQRLRTHSLPRCRQLPPPASLCSPQCHASKVVFVTLARQLQGWDFVDCQLYTDHLASLGACEWPRDKFLDAVAASVERPIPARLWRFDDER